MSIIIVYRVLLIVNNLILSLAKLNDKDTYSAVISKSYLSELIESLIKTGLEAENCNYILLNKQVILAAILIMVEFSDLFENEDEFF